ncbi:potassium channel family protein [Halomonas shantousis]
MEDRITPFQLFILVLSFYVLGALIADTFFNLSPEVSRLLYYMDVIVCVFFFTDFCIRFRAAKDKWRFMRWGWIDLLASIPAGVLLGGRAFRVVQIIRLLRALKSFKMIWRILFRNRAKGIFASVATMTILLVAFGALTMLLIEGPNPESSIDTAEEALWWAFVTITTVGYGDYYPVTSLGRLVAALLMIGGVGLFGSFAAYVSSMFVHDQGEQESRQHKADREMIRHLHAQLITLTEEVRMLRADMADHHSVHGIDKIEKDVATPPANTYRSEEKKP